MGAIDLPEVAGKGLKTSARQSADCRGQFGISCRRAATTSARCAEAVVGSPGFRELGTDVSSKAPMTAWDSSCWAVVCCRWTFRGLTWPSQSGWRTRKEGVGEEGVRKKTEDPVPEPVPDPVEKQLPDCRHGPPQLQPSAPRRWWYPWLP